MPLPFDKAQSDPAFLKVVLASQMDPDRMRAFDRKFMTNVEFEGVSTDTLPLFRSHCYATYYTSYSDAYLEQLRAPKD